MGHPFTIKAGGSKRPNLICFKLGSQGDGSRLTQEQFLDKLHSLPQGYNGKIRVIEPKFCLLDHENTLISYIADEYLELYGQLIYTMP